MADLDAAFAATEKQAADLDAALKKRVADLDAAFAATEKLAEKSDTALGESIKRQQADDRSYIAKLIVRAFVVLMAWVVVAATLGAYLYDWDRLAEPGKFLMAILSSVMLPVVTLVIGHYFGKER